jgi:hypothetical protein
MGFWLAGKKGGVAWGFLQALVVRDDGSIFSGKLGLGCAQR